MYTRRLVLPQRSFLLLGPRGTGKTTWLRDRLPDAHWYNLLLDREQLRLMRDPGLFRQEIEALPSRSWVVVDEVQRLPSLMNEIHDALASSSRRWRFALTGSSARRLRRDDVNLLAGRVVMRSMLPLTVAELGTMPAVDDLLRFGMLPIVRNARGAAARIDLLEAYHETYLAQEIRAEALVRSLDAFARFLEIAALANAQVTNTAALARDAALELRARVARHHAVQVGIAQVAAGGAVEADQQLGAGARTDRHGGQRHRPLLAQGSRQLVVQRRHAYQSNGSMKRWMVPPQVRPTAKARFPRAICARRGVNGPPCAVASRIRPIRASGLSGSTC